MNSVNCLLSPEGYEWGVPSISGGLSQNHAGPSNDSVHSHVFHSYEPFHATTAETPQIPSTFQGINPQSPAPEDVSMEGREASTEQENPPALSVTAQPKAPRRSRLGNLDLETYKEELKQLYLIEDKSLKNVMTIMKENHSLPKSYVTSNSR